MNTTIKQFLFFILFSMVGISVLSAQDNPFSPDVKWTSKESAGKGRTKACVYLTGNEDVIYYLYRTGTPPERSNTGDYFVKHDLKSDKIESFEPNLKNIKNTEREFEWVEVINGDIYLFSSFNNKKHKKYYFFAETIKKEPFELSRDERMIGEIDYSNIKGGKLSSLAITLSPDESKALVSYYLLNKKGKILSFGMEMFDNEMNSLWKRSNDFPAISEDEKVYWGSYAVDNGGNAYLANRIYGKKDKKLFVTCFANDGAEATVKEITLSDKYYALDELLETNDKNQVVCAGFFSQTGNQSAIGAFSAILNPGTANQFAVKETLFSNEYLTKGLSEKEADKTLEKKEKGKDFDDDYYYTFGDVYFKKDGSFYVVAEKTAVITYEKRQGGIASKYNIYYYDDISLLNFNQDGSLGWAYKIPKYQQVFNEDRNRASYAIGFDDNDTVYIIYSTLKRFLGKVKSGETQPYLIKVTGDGKDSWNELFADDDTHKSFSPRNSHGLSNGIFLLNRTHYGAPLIGGSSLQWGIADMK